VTVSVQEVGEYLQRLRDAGDLEFAFFLERHPPILFDAVARDARRRLAFGGDQPLPSVGEVLAHGRAVAARSVPAAAPPPGRDVPATDAEFPAGSVEVVEEVRSGFRW